MAISDSTKQYLIPGFLYSFSSPNTFFPSKLLPSGPAQQSLSLSPSLMEKSGSFVIPAPNEPWKIQMYSPAFYAACTAGGFLSCILPHVAVSRLNLARHTMPSGFAISAAKGSLIFGFYEFFKKQYSYSMGPEHANEHKTLIYLASSASAAIVTGGLLVGLHKVLRIIGSPTRDNITLWQLQIPDVMMKFASFETVVGMIYKHVIPIPKDHCSKPLQLGVSFASGYIIGVFSAIICNPGMNIVSFRNNTDGASIVDMLATKKLSLWSLFTRGLPLRMVVLGTYTGAEWIIYDAFKVLVGVPTTGGVAMV